MDKKIFDKELEGNIIAAMIMERACFETAQEKGIAPDDFVHPAFSKAYNIMFTNNINDYVSISSAIDNEMQAQEIKEEVLGFISSASFSHWLKLLLIKSAHRKLNNLGDEIPRIVHEDCSIEEKIDRVNAKLMENKITKNFGIPKLAKDISLNIMDELSQSGESKTIIKTGFSNVDNKILGFKPGDLIVIAGRPAMGKTTFAMNVATNNALAGKNVLVFSLEMTNEQLLKKIISSIAEVSMDNILKNSMDQNQTKKFIDAMQMINETSLYLFDNAPVTIETLINKTNSLAVSKKIDLIVVDYLQLLMTSSKAPTNSDSRAASMTYISNLLKGLAKQVSCPIIALSQLNRGVEGRTDKRPVLSDLRDSGSIEQDADMVAMLYRDGYYTENPHDTASEIIFRKNRLGDIGTFGLSFQGEISKFSSTLDEIFGSTKKAKDLYEQI